MHHEELASLQRPRYGSIVDDERLSAEEMDERRRQNIAYEYLCHLEEAKSLSCPGELLIFGRSVYSGSVSCGKDPSGQNVQMDKHIMQWESNWLMGQAKGLSQKIKGDVWLSLYWGTLIQRTSVEIQWRWPDNSEESFVPGTWGILTLAGSDGAPGQWPAQADETRIKWMEVCLDEELPPTTELEEGLRNGVYLAKLAKFFAPNVVSDKKIYDVEQARYKIFYPETTDVYDRKNIPRMIYCIHALSLYLFKLGLAPQIQDLLGKVDFTEEEISNMRKELEKYGIQMPSFSKIGGILASELSVDEAALHAAVIAINEAVEKGIAEQTIVTLRNPNAMLLNVDEELAQDYQNELFDAKGRKNQMQDSSLTLPKVHVALVQVNEAIDWQDEGALMAGLNRPALSLLEVLPQNSSWYLLQLCDAKEQKMQIAGIPNMLDKSEIQKEVSVANVEAEAHKLKLIAVDNINTAIRNCDPSKTLVALMKPEAQLPVVHSFAAAVYQTELFNLQQQNAVNYLAHDELSIAVEMLSAVVLLNQTLENKDILMIKNHLRDPCIGFNNLEEENLQRYADTLLSIKSEASSQGQDYLSWNDIQNCIDMVNMQIQEENERIIAIGHINEAVDQGNPEKTLEALLLPTAKLQDVRPANARHYQDVLHHAKAQKCKVAAAIIKYGQQHYSHNYEFV
ncbi:hypothetical protein DUI87_06773 [Hirundo rustica rustica]|uniref:Calponin-homology (CH) domain-containing protein n=1 Tax=Hirundo rustica rustica TaxID=333673 RepID=A0A3M0KTE6_HIRRU|nr:hypothetical protein DUI87_06773 [Hirundo rustica rustica]